MLEIPEAVTIAKQLNDTIRKRRIMAITAQKSPHKFAWFAGDPKKYHGMLKGKAVGRAAARGGMIELSVEDLVLLFGDGVRLAYHETKEEQPAKHQLLIEFEDACSLSASVQMYGGMWCFKAGAFDNPYYLAALSKPSPLSAQFSEEYFLAMINEDAVQKLSVKVFLATEQRIPGLGNGVLQDILYNAKIHPKRKIDTLSSREKTILCQAIKKTLAEMALKGGRDTEKDLFGSPGKYRTKLSRNTSGTPCLTCGAVIKKEAYMGGSIYYCPGCQAL